MHEGHSEPLHSSPLVPVPPAPAPAPAPAPVRKYRNTCRKSEFRAGRVGEHAYSVWRHAPCGCGAMAHGAVGSVCFSLKFGVFYPYNVSRCILFTIHVEHINYR